MINLLTRVISQKPFLLDECPNSYAAKSVSFFQYIEEESFFPSPHSGKDTSSEEHPSFYIVCAGLPLDYGFNCLLSRLASLG